MTLLERLAERWERMDSASATKIDRILKERREAASEINRLRSQVATLTGTLHGIASQIVNLPRSGTAETIYQMATNAIESE